MSRLSLDLSRAQPRYDVIVVGSGYGGGVAASRLARAGKRVAVLERGKEFVTGSFPSRFPDLRSEMQVSGRNVRIGPDSALYDVRLGDDMHVLVGRGLGGGSLVNAGVALRPDPRVFADPVWPGPIVQDGSLDEGFRRAETWLAPSVDPHGAARTKYQALRAAGRTIGREPVVPRVVVSFGDRANAAGVHQPACTACGDCCGGCNVGAKNTVALTYLPDAARHGAELFTLAEVSHVERAPDGSWQVHARVTGEPQSRQVLSADLVVLAAGALGSTEILLRSRERGLAVSDRLGHRFSANGDIIAFGWGARDPVNAIGVGHPSRVPGLEVGAAVTGQIELRDPHDLASELNVQEGALPSALAPILPVLFLPDGRLLGALQSLVSGVYRGPFARLQTFFAVSHDNAGGRFVLDNDRLQLIWPGAREQPVYQRLDAVLGELVASAGGSYVKNPLAGTVMGHQPATAHPLGGCPMGRDRSDGVVDHRGGVFDALSAAPAATHRGLYVIDGSIVPRSLGVNPLLTITALAERALIHIGAELGFSANADPAGAMSGLTPQTIGTAASRRAN